MQIDRLPLYLVSITHSATVGSFWRAPASRQSPPWTRLNAADRLIYGKLMQVIKWSLKFHLSIIVDAVDFSTAVGDWLPVGIIFWEAYCMNNKGSDWHHVKRVRRLCS